MIWWTPGRRAGGVARCMLTAAESPQTTCVKKCFSPTHVTPPGFASRPFSWQYPWRPAPQRRRSPSMPPASSVPAARRLRYPGSLMATHSRVRTESCAYSGWTLRRGENGVSGRPPAAYGYWPAPRLGLSPGRGTETPAAVSCITYTPWAETASARYWYGKVWPGPGPRTGSIGIPWSSWNEGRSGPGPGVCGETV